MVKFFHLTTLMSAIVSFAYAWVAFCQRSTLLSAPLSFPLSLSSILSFILSPVCHTHTHTHTHYFSLAFLWFDCIEVSISLTNKFPFLTRSRKPPLVLQMTLHHKWQLLFVYRSLFHLEEIIKKQTVIRLRRRTGTFTNINTVASLSSSCSYSGCCSTSRYYRPEHTPNTRSWWQQ